MGTNQQEAHKIIESAFDGVPRSRTSLRQFVLTDQKGMAGTITAEEWRVAGLLRADTKWQEVSELEIEHCGCLLAHMQAEEFRYYLPAYMRYSVEHARDSIMESMIPAFVVFGLTPSQRHPSYSVRQYSLLNPSQRTAVTLFLRFMVDHADEYSVKDAKSALAFWQVSA